ncbi:glycoside hydrolase family 113 [Kitasatospora sp. NPDC054939]
MKRFVIFVLPTFVLGITIGVPIVWGDHPIKFEHRKPTAVQWNAEPVGQGRVWGFGDDGPKLPAPDTGPKVTRAWQPGTPEWGVQVYWLDDPADPESYVAGKADRIVKYVVGLNANSLSVTFPFYTAGRKASVVAARPTTPTPERLAILLDTAHRAGLRTVVRPLMDESTFEKGPNGWRGNIAPADEDSWFASYEKLLQPYLKVAQDHKAASFVIGTEFNSMEGNQRWSGLVERAGKTFTGELEYDANWDNWLKGPIKVPVEHFGVDAYFPAKSAADDATQDDLVASWNGWLNRRGTGPQPTTKLTEVGIPAQKGAYKTPGDFYTKRTVNEGIQATWYGAVCQVARERQVAGLYFWALQFGIDPNLPANADTPRMDFAGRPASEEAIRTCFAQTYEVPAAH